jgi:hypothetical protein
MTRRRHPPLVREFVVALARHGRAADVDLGASGHFKITWLANGHKRFITLGASPSDYRADRNARATLRRLLREEDRP